LSKNFRRQSYSATNYLSSGINISAGNLGLKAPTQIGKMRVSRLTRGALCSQR